MSDERIPHLTEVPERPREPGLAGRIAQVRRFTKPAGIDKGLCPSCYDTGFVHAIRGGRLGVLYRKTGDDKYGTDTGPLVRCTCSEAERKLRKFRGEDVKQLVESTDYED